MPRRRAGVRAHRDRGDDGRPRRQLPVSALPVDGTYPSGTTKYEKRNISDFVAVWDPELCIQCGNCSFVCPHSVIRSRYYEPDRLDGAPDGFRSAPLNGAGLPDARYTLQVYVEDCTGCGLCVEACPVSAADEPGRKAINLDDREPLLASERAEHRLLRAAAGERPHARGLRHRARDAVPRAAVRVLRRLRRVRRDAVPEAALAAVRRPPDGRQRHRLLVDLRRQPADDAVDGQRRRARPGVVELAVRGQRRVRARAATRGRSPHRARPPPPARAARRGRRRAGGRDPVRAAAARVRAACAARTDRGARAPARRARRSGGRGPAQRARPPGPPQRVDRRWRRLGVRHRLGRARSRAGERQERQRARDGHRGVLQHRRADVQGDAARGGREVRRRGQDRRRPRTSRCRRSRTRTCTSRGWRSAPIPSRPCARSARPRRTTGRR